MKIRLCWILPAFGLLLFFGETYDSVRLNRDLRARIPYRRDFYWSTFRLQSDPLGKLPPAPCGADINPKTCADWWAVRDVIVDPGAILSTLMISSLPAFFVAMKTVRGLGRLGVNEVYSFFVLTPILLSAWYFFLGWVLDRLWIRLKRKKTAAI